MKIMTNSMIKIRQVTRLSVQGGRITNVNPGQARYLDIQHQLALQRSSKSFSVQSINRANKFQLQSVDSKKKYAIYFYSPVGRYDVSLLEHGLLVVGEVLLHQLLLVPPEVVQKDPENQSIKINHLNQLFTLCTLYKLIYSLCNKEKFL